ncbi:uridine kinase, partial [Streptomyces sp. NPDC058953]
MEHELDRLAVEVYAAPPSCGPVRLVAVDGHAGSGKSTFTGLFATALAARAPGGGDSPVGVLHLDDLASHEAYFGWTGRMLDQVIEPLSRGVSAHYKPYDWNARRFTAPRALPPTPVILIEGVGAGRAALRPYLARLLWMERAPDESWPRGRSRDGIGLSAFWD